MLKNILDTFASWQKKAENGITIGGHRLTWSFKAMEESQKADSL